MLSCRLNKKAAKWKKSQQIYSLNQEKSTTSSDKELKVDDIDKDLSTKESPENEKDDSRKGIKGRIMYWVIHF